MFEIGDESLRLLLEKMAEVYHQHEPTESSALYQALKEEGFSRYIDALWQVQMIRQQNPDLRKLRRDIDNTILEMQLKQLDNEICDCRRRIETAESFPRRSLSTLSNAEKRACSFAGGKKYRITVVFTKRLNYLL